MFIQIGQENSLSCYRNMRDFVFQIWPKLTYDALKEYKSFMKAAEGQKIKDQQDG